MSELESAMIRPESKCKSRPVIVPECFSGKKCYKNWTDQFESIAEINHWNDEQKLMWLKVCVTGRALMAYKKYPTTARDCFKNTVKAL